MNDFGFKFDNSYLNLPEIFYTKLSPSKVKSPKIVIFNDDLALKMGLNFAEKTDLQKATLFSGNQLPAETISFSQAYAGHQFGHFTILGDGRAHLLGEHILPDGQRLDIQYKGSGRTPYSRNGDGRAVLGPMLREYIISEAMYALGIPTSRSLAVVATGDAVMRNKLLPGAILTRVAASHIRVGTFEYSAVREDQKSLEMLLDYTIKRHFPAIIDDSNIAVSFLKIVMDRQVDLIVNWMRVGFIHGVMNTDNMTISGETIDYGPCAFMNTYDPNTVFSSIDHQGRYAYANQPNIAQWNLVCLAKTLLPFFSQNESEAIQIAQDVIRSFTDLYDSKWLNMMRCKLGLFGADPLDKQLIFDLLDWMKTENADFTNTFYDLTYQESLVGDAYATQTFNQWHQRWKKRLNQNQKNSADSFQLMKQNNPVIIPRNHNVETTLTAAETGDLKPFNRFLNALKTPYEYNDCITDYQKPPSADERVYQTFCGT